MLTILRLFNSYTIDTKYTVHRGITTVQTFSYPVTLRHILHMLQCDCCQYEAGEAHASPRFRKGTGAMTGLILAGSKVPAQYQ